MSSKKNLLIGGITLGTGRIRNAGTAALQSRNAMEESLIRNNYLGSAPFNTINMVFRYGNKDDWNPEIGCIDSKNNELPVAIEFNSNNLMKMDLDELKRWFTLAIIEALCDISANYNLPYEFLDEMRKPNKPNGDHHKTNLGHP